MGRDTVILSGNVLNLLDMCASNEKLDTVKHGERHMASWKIF